MGVMETVGRTLLLLLPAMVANGSAVMVKRGTPIDLGRLFIDGRRVLGDGKTFEGFIVGMSFSLVISGMLASIFADTVWMFLGVAAGVGAMLGDMGGSFLKRRLGIHRGGRLPVVDQLDFMVGAVMLLYLIGVSLRLSGVVGAAIFILIAHKATNLVAYKLGLKDVPW